MFHELCRIINYKFILFISIFSISIKSRMWDAWVVVDGGMSFHFNDGALLNLEMHEEDALRCVSLS